MSPLRIAGFVFIALSCLFLVANLWYWLIDAGSGVSLYDIWYKFWPTGLIVIQGFIERHVWAALWHGIAIILVQPAWIVMGIAGLLCVGLGRRKVE